MKKYHASPESHLSRPERIIALLNRIAEGPVRLSSITKKSQQKKKLLETKYPFGLKGLVSVERWAVHNNPSAATDMLVIQPAGLELLERLKTNPKAQVSGKVYAWKPRVSIKAQELQKAKNERFFRKKLKEMKEKIKNGFSQTETGLGKSGNLADFAASTGYFADALDARRDDARRPFVKFADGRQFGNEADEENV